MAGGFATWDEDIWGECGYLGGSFRASGEDILAGSFRAGGEDIWPGRGYLAGSFGAGDEDIWVGRGYLAGHFRVGGEDMWVGRKYLAGSFRAMGVEAAPAYMLATWAMGGWGSGAKKHKFSDEATSDGSIWAMNAFFCISHISWTRLAMSIGLRTRKMTQKSTSRSTHIKSQKQKITNLVTKRPQMARFGQ